MSDWQVGDLAGCLKRDAWTHAHSNTLADAGPDFNQVTTVRGVGIDCSVVVLWFEGYPGDAIEQAYQADRFRKIRPDEREACEPEFVTLIKRTKRTVTA